LACIALKYHLDQSDLEKLYFKYVSPGGKKPIVFNLKGYREGKLVNEKSFGPSTQFAYRFEKSSEFLNNAETYDVTRVSIKFVDQYGTQLHYAFRTVSFETKGPDCGHRPLDHRSRRGRCLRLRPQFVDRPRARKPADRPHRPRRLQRRLHGSIGEER
jgi:hypothetical protein